MGCFGLKLCKFIKTVYSWLVSLEAKAFNKKILNKSCDYPFKSLYRDQRELEIDKLHQTILD